MIWKDDRVAQTKTNSFGYDNLGRLTLVTFSSGAVINYSYAADGTKLRESRTASGTTTTTDYTGNVVLENGTRSRLLFDGGYMSLSDNAYHYFLTDHLGSVRVVANASGTAEEYDHYYPLGGPIAKYSTATSLQPQKFQGKEWGASKGLNLYDFGARRYDPATGRWLSQDPLSEKYYAHSPYLFCAANPMRFVDPMGLDDYDFKRNGEWSKTENVDPYDRLIVGDHSLIITDQTIMGGMKENLFGYMNLEGDTYEKKLHYSIIKSESENMAKKVFKFLADNTNVEWLLIKGEDNTLLLGTQHFSDKIDEGSFDFWIKKEGNTIFDNPIFRIHNHPFGYVSERASMEKDLRNYLDNPHTASYVYFNSSGNVYSLSIGEALLNKDWKW